MFRFIHDPGHGWLEVSISLLDTLNIKNQISEYSYVYNGKAYLEEDCDMPIFLNAYKASFGDSPNITSVFQKRTRIRTYPRI